jgi:cytochrome b6-f complex iron-sulfur subunit
MARPEGEGPRSDRDALPRQPERRRFLLGVLRAAAAGAVAPGLVSGCASEPQDPRHAVDLSGLAAGERITVPDPEGPFEVIRTDTGVVARSLLCTHQGCVVEWQAEAREYVCPCHDARFDADGVPLYGPAPRPLRMLPVEVRGDRAIVDPRPPEA